VTYLHEEETYAESFEMIWCRNTRHSTNTHAWLQIERLHLCQ